MIRDKIADACSLTRRTFLKATGALATAAAIGGSHAVLTRTESLAAPVMAADAEEQIIPSVCGGCHNCCPMDVVVKGNRVVRAQGMKGDSRTNGMLCARGLSGSQIAHDPRRLMYPLRRTGERGSGEFKRISWDEALSELADKMLAARERATDRGLCSSAVGRHRCGDSPTICSSACAIPSATKCSWAAATCFIPRAIGEALTYGGLPLLHDYDNTDLMIFWGRQPAFSGAPLGKKIFDARDRGAKMVVVDPLRFHIGAQADQFIQIEPGTDMAMMLAMLYVIVEKGLWDHDVVDNYTNDPGLTGLRAHLQGDNRLGTAFTPEWAAEITGVDADVIRNLAVTYATTPKACIIPGHGLEGRVNVSQTTRAQALLTLITGHFDAPGCDVTTLPGPARNPEFFLEDRVVEGYKREDPVFLFAVPPYNPPVSGYPLEFMMQGQISTPDTFRLMNEGKVKVCIWQGNNPMVMLAQPSVTRAALDKVDFLVVIDPLPI